VENEDFKYKLALTLIPKIGAITAKKLIAYVGSPEGVFRETPTNLRRIPGIGGYLAGQVSLRNFVAEAETEILAMKKSKISCVYYQDPEYPWRLKNCDDGPLILYYKGSPDFSRTKILSIVGTRNATSHGKEVCESLIAELSAKYPDLIIVSGLAYGIDITAHRLSLEYGLDTFAVLAHGLNTIYPSSHLDSALRIMKQGGLLSDFHSSIKPERNNFLRRNRIIAGLAEATLVIESAEKGGALITAEIASSYNREVLAIPGRVKDTYSVGCNNLIKNNIAALINNASDIESLLNWETTKQAIERQQTITLPLSEDETKIIQCISKESGIGQEIISVRTGIPIHKLIGTLLQMELRNWITVMPGNLYRALVRL
jgi:DNA processing protein